jgi:hypothetical protein
MEAVRETQKKFGSRAMLTAIALGFVLILMGFKPMGKGLVLGTCFSILNFVLIGEMLPLRLGRSQRRTFLFSMSSIFVRYTILAIPLIVAFYYEQFHLGGVIAGLFMIQFVILTDTLLNKTAVFSGRTL